MKIQEIFNKAEKGGWEDHYDAKGCEQSAIDHAINDPSFWQALGKSLGWGHTERRWCELKVAVYSNEQKGREGEIVGETRDKNGWIVRWTGIKSRYAYHKDHITEFERGKSYLERWHALIDHLAEGKSIESYFEEIK